MGYLVSHFTKQTTTDAIVDFCKDGGVEVLKCELLQSKSQWHKCFKVSVKADLRDSLLEAEFWPENIYVGKFLKPTSLNSN